MQPILSAGRRSLALVLLSVVFAVEPAFATGASFTKISSVPRTLTPPAVASSVESAAKGLVSPDRKTLTFTEKTIRLVIQTGPDTDMLSYRIAGLRNPTLIVPPGAEIRALFINSDEDMFHNIRFGAWRSSWPNQMEGLQESSVGTAPLAHKTETIFHADELVLRVPAAAGKYAYFCTVRGHAQGGMWGTLLVSPGLAAPAAPSQSGSDMPGMSMPGMSSMSMSSSVDLNDPMAQEASGTAWLPSSSPVYAKMIMEPNGGMLMLHGDIHARYDNVGSRRGDRRVDAPNWFMGMYSRPLSDKSQLGLRAMLSLDPITEGGYGYPLLFQTGETWHRQPLHDRQHPHDLFSELAVTYSRLLGGGRSAYLYLGYPGEPALGPPTFMHRLIAYDLPDAPIGHHWQDATHITFGVATAGLNFGSKVKLEASDFTGREPDENRYSFDKPRFDSYSGRLSYNPDTNNALQISYGFIKNPEGDGADVHRTTASWVYNKPLGEDANVTTTLVWGRNNFTSEGNSNSYLAEADYQRGVSTFFTRIENIQKSGHELVLPAPFDTARKYTLGEYTVGYMRDLTHGQGIDTGVGFAVTANTKPAALDPFYGTGTPLSFELFLRLRPSRLRMSGPPMPVMNNGAGESTLHVTSIIAPDPPRAGQSSTLTVTVTDPGGKPVPGARITADVAMTTMDMGTSHPAFKDTGNGRYVGAVSFSMPGPWQVTLHITPPNGGAMLTKTLAYNVIR